MMDFSAKVGTFLRCLGLFLALLAGPLAWASENGEEKFSPKDMIFHHVTDAHDWHFATVGKKHFTLYLPVIAYAPGDGFSTFSAAQLHHHDDAGMAAEGHVEDGVEMGDEHATVGTATAGHSDAAAHAAMGPTYKGYFLDEHDHLHRADGKTFYDLSITKNVASMFVSVLLLSVVFFSVAGAYKKTGNGRPKGLQSLLEPIIVFVRDDIAKPNIGDKYERYLPYLLTVFFFIWFNNLLGLLPGGANLTGNISVTIVLALFTFIITTLSANKAYWQHIYNTPGLPWWLKFPVPLMPFVEFLGVFTKPFSLMIRLFANITAGHIIILSLLSLIFIFESYAVGVVSTVFVTAMSFLELLVAILQAYVFTLLTAMYFGGAVAEHAHDHEHDHENEYEHEFGHDEVAKASL